MSCGGEERLAPFSLMYYFLGTITDQHEDEKPLVKLFRRAVRDGDVFFDIGANFGFYSWFVGPLCGKAGAVHAFEANPLLTDHLRRSVSLNEAVANISINAVAVGRSPEVTMELYDPERIGGSSLYRLDWLDSGKSVTVPVTTIDAYRRVAGVKRIDVIKIDIEGAELDAFLGMEETFAECPPWLIVCELIVGDIRGGDPCEVMALLKRWGYEARYIRTSDGRLGEIVDDRAVRQEGQSVINVAFVRPQVWATRRDLFGSEEKISHERRSGRARVAPSSALACETDTEKGMLRRW
jgi:FkbM family methyltransferase